MLFCMKTSAVAKFPLSKDSNAGAMSSFHLSDLWPDLLYNSISLLVLAMSAGFSFSPTGTGFCFCKMGCAPNMRFRSSPEKVLPG